MRLHHLLPLLLLIGSFFLSHPSIAKTIHVPSDAASVKEAVEMAVSGDEIIIEGNSVNWVSTSGEGGIVVKDKTISIAGKSDTAQAQFGSAQLYQYTPYVSPFPVEPFSSMLWIENSHVTLRNLRFNGGFTTHTSTGTHSFSTVAPIRLISGSLSLDNCYLLGSIESRGSITLRNTILIADNHVVGFPYHTHDSFEYALAIRSATGVVIKMDHSLIDAREQKTPEGGTYSSGYLSVLLQNLNDSRIVINDSQIYGGYYTFDYRSPSYHPGSPGLTVLNCLNLDMDLDQSSISGGLGNSYAQSFLDSGKGGNAQPGGHGALVQDSILKITGGILSGGLGGYGNVRMPDAYREEIIPGQGGSGLSLVRSSVVHLDTQLIAGLGGQQQQPDYSYIDNVGIPGESISIDEFSTFQEITSLPDWSVY